MLQKFVTYLFLHNLDNEYTTKKRVWYKHYNYNIKIQRTPHIIHIFI